MTQRFRFITMPLLRPVALITVVIQLINELRTYDLVYVLTRGGSDISTDVLSYFAYRRSFRGLQLNEGAAASFVLLMAVSCFSVALFILRNRREL